MNKTTLRTCFILLFWLPAISSMGQTWSIGVYVNGINFHLKKPLNPNLFHRTLSQDKRLVYNLAGGIRVSYYLNNYLGITITQVLAPRDCGNRFFGMTHAGVFLSTRYFNDSPHEGLLIGGPILFYRKNWNDLPGYTDDQMMKQSKNKQWQYKFVWHGGFLEYRYHYTPYQAAGIHLMPGIPELLSFSAHHTSFIK
ncbi:MAG: hypothetical protein ACK5HE_02395 [Bacteroidota bacterium]